MNAMADLALEGGLTSSNLIRPTYLGRIGRMLTAPVSRWRRATSYRGRSKAINASLGLAILTVLVLSSVRTASAVPILQLYLEGGQYDPVTETWVVTPEGSSAGAPFRLWAMGNVAGPGGKGTITDVRLAIAFSEDDQGLSISLWPSQAGGLGVGSYNGVTDPSVPSDPELNLTVQTSLGEVTTGPDGLVTNGGTPMLGSGKKLPPHGVYGPGTVWQEYWLGDFALTDSPVGDFIGSFPDDFRQNAGQINVYEVSALGFSGATLHFDLYNTIAGKNHCKFAPFSHDADGEANIIPEPASLIVWCLIGLTWAGSAWTYRSRFRRR
jgi:hypothetical protein